MSPQFHQNPKFHHERPASLKFFLNISKGKGSYGKVYLRIIVNRKKAEVATSYNLLPEEWDKFMDFIKTHFYFKVTYDFYLDGYFKKKSLTLCKFSKALQKSISERFLLSMGLGGNRFVQNLL